MTKIIYTLRLVTKLMDRGQIPILSMPNPKEPRLTCWVFNDTEEFEQTLSMILEEEKHYGRS